MPEHRGEASAARLSGLGPAARQRHDHRDHLALQPLPQARVDRPQKRLVHGDDAGLAPVDAPPMPYHLYIMSSRSRVLYVGVTSQLSARVRQHKEASPDRFTGRYHIDRLVYSEEYQDVRDAIRREKQIKGWLRARKIALIESANPGWEDLSEWL